MQVLSNYLSDFFLQNSFFFVLLQVTIYNAYYDCNWKCKFQISHHNNKARHIRKNLNKLIKNFRP